jgi:hypothetical protein
MKEDYRQLQQQICTLTGLVASTMDSQVALYKLVLPLLHELPRKERQNLENAIKTAEKAVVNLRAELAKQPPL